MQRLLDVKRTQIQMVRDRGYNIPDEELSILNMNLRQFELYIQSKEAIKVRATIGDILNGDYLKITNGNISGAIYVSYARKQEGKRKISVEVARGFVKRLSEQMDPEYTEGILICDAPLSSSAEKTLAELITPRWQFFSETELTHNVTLRQETQIHQLLSPEEKEQKLKQFGTGLGGLLLIEINDPIIKYYGWPVGGLVRIIRDDSSVGILSFKSVNYRTIIG